MLSMDAASLPALYHLVLGRTAWALGPHATDAEDIEEEDRVSTLRRASAGAEERTQLPNLVQPAPEIQELTQPRLVA